MKVTIEVPLTPAYVMGNAHSGYWWNATYDADLAPKHRLLKRTREGRVHWPKLTKAKLAAGCALVAATVQNDAMVGRLLSKDGRPDGYDLDVLLQFSLFGEAVYG